MTANSQMHFIIQCDMPFAKERNGAPCLCQSLIALSVKNYLNSTFFFKKKFLFAVLGMKPWFGCMLCCTLNPEKIEINSAIIFIYMFTYMSA